MAALSSKDFGSLFNKFQYQGSYSEFDDETGYNEFALRNYDAQLGRWTGVDPYNEFPSPYTGMGNDPANNVDPDGGDIFGILADNSSWLTNQAFDAAEGFIAGATIGALTSKGGNKWLQDGLIGSGAALAYADVPWGDVGNWISKQFNGFFNPTLAYWESEFLALDLDGSPRAYNPTNTGVVPNVNGGIDKKGKGPRYGIVMDDNGNDVIQGVGDPYPGYYVSKTSYPKYAKDQKDPRAYLDAEKIPYLVLNKKLKKLGYTLGSVGKIQNLNTGFTTWFLVGDANNAQTKVEMSPALANNLNIPVDFGHSNNCNCDRYKGISDDKNSIKVKIFNHSDQSLIKR